MEKFGLPKSGEKRSWHVKEGIVTFCDTFCAGRHVSAITSLDKSQNTSSLIEFSVRCCGGAKSQS